MPRFNTKIFAPTVAHHQLRGFATPVQSEVSDSKVPAKPKHGFFGIFNQVKGAI